MISVAGVKPAGFMLCLSPVDRGYTVGQNG